MAHKQLSCKNIGELNRGLAEMAIDKALNDAITDLDDRGEEDGKPREVLIKLSMVKRPDGLVETDLQTKVTVPPRRTPATVIRPVHKDGQTKLFFEVFSPDNPDQPAFIGDDGEVHTEKPA